MHLILRLSLWGALCLVGPASLTGGDLYRGECHVRFEGDSTLHGFSGELPPLPLEVQVERTPAGTALLRAVIPVAVTNLTTHHEKRDANMHRMFDAARQPLAHVEVRDASLDAARLIPQSSPLTGVLPIRLAICGTTNEIVAVTRNQNGTADRWEFDLDFEVSLKAYRLKPPSAVLGAVRVKDAVEVRTHVVVHRQPSRP